MNLKPCPCCKRQQTTKNAEPKGRTEMGFPMLMFNCRSCNSTFVVMNASDVEKMRAKKAVAA